jgi:hypothetical protein
MGATVTVTPIDQSPRVREAQQAFEAKHRMHAEEEARVVRLGSRVDPHVAQHRPAASEEELLEAAIELPGARVRHARLTQELRAAEQALDEARAAERRRQLATLRDVKANALQRLSKKLQEAATVNSELAAIEEAERGLQPLQFTDVFAWPWLLPASATRDSFFDHWRGSVRQEYGLDV